MVKGKKLKSDRRKLKGKGSGHRRKVRKTGKMAELENRIGQEQVRGERKSKTIQRKLRAAEIKINELESLTIEQQRKLDVLVPINSMKVSLSELGEKLDGRTSRLSSEQRDLGVWTSQLESRLFDLEANSRNGISKEELEKVMSAITGDLESRVGHLEEHLANPRSELNSVNSKLRNLDQQIYF